MESALKSHGPRESLELSIVRIGLETTELQRTKCKSRLWLGAGEYRCLVPDADEPPTQRTPSRFGETGRRSLSLSLAWPRRVPDSGVSNDSHLRYCRVSGPDYAAYCRAPRHVRFRSANALSRLLSRAARSSETSPRRPNGGSNAFVRSVRSQNTLSKSESAESARARPSWSRDSLSLNDARLLKIPLVFFFSG